MRRAGDLIWMALATAALLVGCSSDGGDETPTAACTALWETQLRLGSRIYAEAPAGGRFGDYLIDFDGNITHPASISCTTALAAGLAGTCRACEGDPSLCELAVRSVFAELPGSCHVCGDDVCTGPEDATSCPEDCGVSCGDGVCEISESVLACPIDCAVACGDRVCGEGETPESCEVDCNYTVGNGLCEPGESPEISPIDCQSGTCGDRVCQSYENSLLCPVDCCFPAACNVDGPVCADDQTLATCLVLGQGNCPQLVDAMPCPLGCERVGVDYDCNAFDSSCPRGRCATCDGIAAAYVQGQGLDSMFVELGCTPGATTCATDFDGTATCVAVPGYPSCSYAPIELCPMGQTCIAGVCQ